jgi:hypothetical protein
MRRACLLLLRGGPNLLPWTSAGLLCIRLQSSASKCAGLETLMDTGGKSDTSTWHGWAGLRAGYSACIACTCHVYVQACRTSVALHCKDRPAHSMYPVQTVCTWYARAQARPQSAHSPGPGATVLLSPNRLLVRPNPAAAASLSSASSPARAAAAADPALIDAVAPGPDLATLLTPCTALSAAAAVAAAVEMLYVPGPGTSCLLGGRDQPGPTLSAAVRPALRANRG